jgi:hypothetical protein
MLEKIINAVSAYCFDVLEIFFAFFERTHALVGFGVPLLLIIVMNMYLPIWVAALITTVVLAPAAAAMAGMIIDLMLLTRRR